MMSKKRSCDYPSSTLAQIIVCGHSYLDSGDWRVLPSIQNTSMHGAEQSSNGSRIYQTGEHQPKGVRPQPINFPILSRKLHENERN